MRSPHPRRDTPRTRSFLLSAWLSLLIGSALLAGGVWGLVTQWPSLAILLRGGIPLICTLAGALIATVGLAELRERSRAKRPG